MADIPQSRTEEILYATINGEEYTGLPESRIEELLLELKEVIEEGGGGGGGTSTIAWKPTVAADGTISWVRTASETKPEDQNIKGPKGDTGETGAKGDTGETGSQGPKGDDGDPGLGIKLVTINQQGHLIITFDDDTTQDAGAIPGGGGAVDSVNGKTGAVTLDAEDVGALPDDTDIPSKTSDLTNDSGFITKAVNDLISYYLKSETYTKAEVNALIGAISTIHFEAVLTLPTEDIQTNVIYLVPKSISQTDNIKDEYINLDGTSAGWEKIGETEIDLSNYVTITALNTALADYVTSTALATTLASYAQTSQLPGVATASTAGLVKPDGTTTSVNAQGVLSVIEQLPAPPVLNLESITSENDVSSKSAMFTAASTSKYLLIMAIANADYFPTITSASVSVNGDAQTLSDYYASTGYGVNSKYAILDLTAGDSVAASIATSIDYYGTSASIALIKLSEEIGDFTIEDSSFSNLANISSEINVDADGFYLLFFFKRADGAGRFNTITRNGKTISSNVVICSQGSSWQVSHGICIVSAKALDTLRVAMTAGGFIACGIMSLATSGISYNTLDDKPQINGVELSGNKTATQLGLVGTSSTAGLLKNDGTVDTTSYATSASVSAITDGQSIDSFSDVESALAGKADTSDLPSVATSSAVGLVKPDGITTTVDANGVLTAVGGSGNTKLKTRYSVSYSSWSSTVNSDGYYTYSLTLSPTLDTTVSPDVLIAGSSNITQPTDTQKTMFGYVERCYLSGSTLTLYAKTKPTNTFYVWVEGVAGSGSGGIVGNVIQPNGESSGGGLDYSSTEHKVGKWMGQDLYSITLTNGTIALATNKLYTIYNNVNIPTDNIQYVEVHPIKQTYSSGQRKLSSFPCRYDTDDTAGTQLFVYIAPYMEVDNAYWAIGKNLTVTVYYTKS